MLKLASSVEKDLQMIERFLLGASDGGEKVREVAKYVFKSGGKRLRPALLVLCSKLFGYRGDAHIKLGAAVEFVHTATLLHDDVVDSAKMRRGKPSVNSVWGNKTSILTGDFLFARASKLVHELKNERIIRILLSVVEKMVEGEFLQMKVQGNIVKGGEAYFEIIRHKTSEFISACCEMGGVLAGASEENLRKLRKFGLELGDAFQIVDDVIDLSGKFSVMGKKPGKDIEEGKVTLPIFCAFKRATPEVRRRIKEIVEKNGKRTRAEIRELIFIVEKAGGTREALEEARKKIEIAKRILKSFPDNIYRDELGKISEYIIKRKE